MRKLTQFVCVILVLACIFPVQVFGLDTDGKASNYFASESCYLDQTSGTTFEIWAEVSGLDIMDEIGTSVIKVQRSTDGSTWTNVKTYTKESYPSMIGKETGAHDCCLTYTATKGYYYRAYVQFYAKKGTGTATLDRYTSKIKL